MTTIYMVNENPDPSGRWRNIGIQRWVESADFATNFTDRDDADHISSKCGGHVVEFTVGDGDVDRAKRGYVQNLCEALDMPMPESQRDDSCVRSWHLADAIRDRFAAKPEPRDDPTVAHRYVEIADVLGLVNRAEGRDGVDVASHGRVMEAVRDGQRALAESDEMFAELQRLRTERNKPEPREPDYWLTEFSSGALSLELRASEKDALNYGPVAVRVYVGEPPPAPVAEREPDAIVVCDDEGVDWDDIFPCPLTETGRDWLDQCTNLTRKVYLDTPPPASGREEWSALKELLAEMTAEKAAALAEVSRLSKALDGARRETESVRVAAREIQRERDELAKQEPVAWRSPFDCDNGWVWTSNSDVAEEWRRCGEVEPLYAAPKPSERGLEIERRAKEAAIAEVAAYRNAGREVHGEKVDARTLNTCAACNAGPDMIGPAHTCGPADPLAHDLGIEAYAPADTPAMVEARRKIHDALSQLAGALSSLEPGRGAAEVQK